MLRLDKVGAEEDFFDVGGHSLLAIRLVARIREAYEFDMTLRTVFEAATITELASRIAASAGDSQVVGEVSDDEELVLLI